MTNLTAVTSSLVRGYLGVSRAWRRRKLGSLKAKAPISLFLAPEAGLEPFFASHALLARVLQDAGHAVIMLSCNGLQPICSLKFAARVGATASGDVQNIACTQCRASIRDVGSRYNLADITLESLLDQVHLDRINKIMASHSQALWETTYDGIEFGAVSLGETLRSQQKLSVDELESKDHDLLKSLVHSSLMVYFAVLVLEAKFNIERIAYFGDYTYYIPPQIFAARRGIPLINISHAYIGDVDRRHLLLRPGHAMNHMLHQVDIWGEYRDRPIERQAVTAIAESTLFRLSAHGGASTYSPNWSQDSSNILEELGLKARRKVLVAYPSSMDEVLCIRRFMRVLEFPFEQEPRPFSDQDEWLWALILWVSKRQDCNLIIRLHPRMGSSSQYQQMRKDFEALPENVAVVDPANKMSSYNIAEIADLVLTGWTSLGLELARFGVPVIAAFPRINPFPVGSFIVFEGAPEAYFAAIEKYLMRSAANLDHIIEAFRWTHFLHWSSLVDVSDVVPEANYPNVPDYQVPRNRELMLKVMMGENLIDLNMARLSKEPSAADQERAAVIYEVERFILFFMTGTVHRDRRLHVQLKGVGVLPAQSTSDIDFMLQVDDTDTVSLIANGRVIERRSLLVARLARMLALAVMPASKPLEHTDL